MMKKLLNHIKRRINLYRYARLAAGVARPQFAVQELREQGYYSQYGQDKWLVEEILPGQVHGTFVDIGANDGITFSNTFFLEKRGWSGIAVEPIPAVYEKLARNRQCTTIHGCVAKTTGKGVFRAITGYSEMLSGLLNEYDPRHKSRIERELGLHGGEYRDIEVDCFSFADVVASQNLTEIDFLNIDVEGAEFNVLSGIDFSRTEIHVVCIENSYLDYRIPKLLIGNGFRFHSVLGDEFYVKPKRV